MNNDAIIFDIDGTLWDACPSLAQGWNNGLVQLGIDRRLTSQQIQGVCGNPFEKCVDILLPEFKDHYPTLLDTLYHSRIEGLKSGGGILYDGVTEGINKLASSYKIFLVSNCQDWYMRFFLHFSNLESVVTGFDCNGMSGLPKDQMLMKIKNNYLLKNPVYVGDTSGDENAANLADMAFIHVSYGFGSPKNTALTFDSFAALVDYFKRQKHIT